MRFRSYESLRLFDVVARHLNFTTAAGELNLTKGAVSYQIGRLEQDLGFPVFARHPRGVTLTQKGKRLWHASQVAFRDLDREIDALRDEMPSRITIAMTSYFASRWLSPRLMTFITAHPQIGLRLQPLVDLLNPDELRAHGIDLSIRWGNGDWSDMEVETLFPCPAFPTAGTAIAERVAREGLDAVIATVPLLHDRDDSTAWRDWHAAAGLTYRGSDDELVIPDPNVRVQAVIDGQGIALNDALVASELESGRLRQISPVLLGNYGYFLCYPAGALETEALAAFHNWIASQAKPTGGIVR